MKIPPFIKQEIDQIHAQLAPEKVSINTVLSQQSNYNKKAVLIQGTVTSVISLDKTDEGAAQSLWFEMPVKITGSATYFYLKSSTGQEILVGYPADLHISAQDDLTIVGTFSAHGITIETKGFLGTKHEQVLNSVGEPFIGAVTIENQTKQKLEYLRSYYQDNVE